MTFLNSKLFALDTAPIKSPIYDVKGNMGSDWIKWFNDLLLVSTNRIATGAPAITLNSDFNFGATPLSADGTFADRWDIEGTSFVLTPTVYASSDNPTGSLNYIKIETSGQQILRLYQKQQDKKALVTNQEVSFSMQYKANVDRQIKTVFKLGYDNNNDGTVDEYITSKEIVLPSASNKPNLIEGFIPTSPSLDQRTNQLYFEVTLDVSSNIAEIDILYIKTEIGQRATYLYIDHPLEQLRITNTP